MLNNKMTWILTGLTTFLLVTLVVASFFQMQGETGNVAFERLQKNGGGSVTAELNQVKSDETNPNLSQKETKAFSQLNLNQIQKQVTESSVLESQSREKILVNEKELAARQSQVAERTALINELEVLSNPETSLADYPVPSETETSLAEYPVPTETEASPAATEPVPTQAATSTKPAYEEPTAPSVPVEVQAPTTPPTASAGVSDISFVTPGSPSAAATNLSKIAGLLKPQGLATYSNFTVNGNQTITVDGVTFAYDSTYVAGSVTGYDGVLLNSYRTASGLATQRGIVATVRPEYGGYAFGTVLFVEGYGLVVVGDINGMGSFDSTFLDICFNDGELVGGAISPGRTSRQVYILSTI